MAQKVRSLLVALLAFTLTALTPAAAGAASFNFENVPVTVKGKAQGNHVLDLAGGTLSCEEFKLEGSSTWLLTTTVLFPTISYGGCTMFGVKATVSTGKCMLELRSDGRFYFGPNTTECNSNPMTVDATVLTKTCHIALPSQILEKAVTYGNSGTGSSREVTMEVKFSSVFYKAEGELCKEAGSKTNGSYTSGSTRLTADRFGGLMSGMWWE